MLKEPYLLIRQLEKGLQFVMIGNVSNDYPSTEVSAVSYFLDMERYSLNNTHHFCTEYFCLL